MNNCKISVIIPVYNVENYLCECVESIVGQTYKNLEIILVDDGSTDNSGYLCDEFKKNDSRIIVIHKKNGGLSDARNYGLNNMTGDFVTFVDSDDFLSKYAIEIMYKYASEMNSDLVFTKNAVRFNDGEIAGVASSNDSYDVKLFSKEEILEYTFYQKTNVTGAPGKLYSKSIFENGLRFPYGVYFEDLATTYQFIMKSEKVIMVDAPLYAYRMRNDGIIHQSFSKKKLTCIDVTTRLFSDISQMMPKLVNAAASRCCSCNRMVYSQIPYNDKKSRNLVWNEIKKYRDIVLFDSKARKRERMSCAISYFGQNIFYLFNIIGLFYKFKILRR